MAGVKTLGLEVAVVDAAAGRHEHVRHGARRVRPVHHPPAQRRPRLHVDTVRRRLHDRDRVPVAATAGSIPWRLKLTTIKPLWSFYIISTYFSHGLK